MSLPSVDMKATSIFLLLAWLMVLVQSHILLEEKPERTNSGGIARFSERLPPISIVDLTKASRRVSRIDAEKNKLAKRKSLPKKKVHPPPPANCVPLHSSSPLLSLGFRQLATALGVVSQVVGRKKPP
ncbi:agouti-signaling protein-like isoform X2 [Eleutherodactylus coqui]|uniref:agouti-signaling protein-like isoform X2 n=1 Tax=Eleutherodactylus coqui TaxID=57060 RepID=UPI0034636149